MMSRLQQLKEMAILVDTYFIWTRDIETQNQMEHWQDSSDVILAHNILKDDCDGRAITIGALLHTQCDIPEHDIYLWRCLTLEGQAADKKFDHAVCGLLIDEVMWISDNRYPSPYTQGWARYQYYDYRRMDDPQWFKYVG